MHHSLCICKQFYCFRVRKWLSNDDLRIIQLISPCRPKEVSLQKIIKQAKKVIWFLIDPANWTNQLIGVRIIGAVLYVL